MKPSEVLREARALLEPPGAWIQGSDRLDNSYCALGAIRAQTRRTGGASKFFRRANGFQGITTWNDHPSRRKHQVLAAFDRAIALAESEGQ